MDKLKKLKFSEKRGGSFLIKFAKVAPVVIAIASIIAAATPNKSDDFILQKVIDISHVMALNVGNAKPAIELDNDY